MFILFGITHPSQLYGITNKFIYSDIFLNVIFLIFMFDVTLYISYFLSSRIGISPKLVFLTNFGISYDDFYDNSLIFIIILGLLVMVSDIYLIFSTKVFMNANILICNENLPNIFKFFFEKEKYSYISNFDQIIKSISIVKYILLAILGKFISLKPSKRMKFLFYIVLTYCLIYGIIIGSRFQIIFPFVIIVFIYFEKIISLKGIIYTFILSYLGLYIFPLVGTLRNISYKRLQADECNKIENVTQSIINNYNYNNVFKVTDNQAIFDIDLTKGGFWYKPIEIILSRINYFDITMKSYYYKLSKNFSNNANFYFDNLVGLIPRAIYPEKKIISSHSDQLAIELGVSKVANNAVGLRPIAESFLYIGNYYLLIAIILGIFFGLSKTFTKNNNLFTYSFFVYVGLIILKRDSFHAVIPGISHETFAYLIMLLLMLILKKLKLNYLIK